MVRYAILALCASLVTSVALHEGGLASSGDYERCLEIIMGQGATYEEAVEHMAFNVTGAYVGNTTPVFIRRVGS